MDPRLRRASVASLKEEKSSSPVDRLHRQARQSILFEERRSSVFRHDPFPTPPLLRTQGLGRTATAETEASPTEAHPGHRLPEPPDGWTGDSAKEPHELSDIFPIAKSSPRKKSTAADSSHAAHPFSQDVDAIEAQSSASKREMIRPRLPRINWLQQLVNLIPRSATLKPGAISGLQVASAAATAHAKAKLHHRSYLHGKRQQIHITEYEAGESCTPRSVPMDLNHISRIQHYLLEASTPRFRAPLLRVIYVQNNEEAMDFLTNIFGLDHASFERFEGSFKDWTQEPKSHRDSSNRTISWRPTYDFTRDIICTIFGLDLASGLAGTHASPNITLPGKKSLGRRLLKTNPSTLCPQRISVYVQRKLDGFPEAGKMGFFHTSPSGNWQCAHQNTILIYENSHDDCEEIFQGLPELLDLEWKANATKDKDQEAALIKTLEHILLHIFTKILRAWRKQLDLLTIQHAQLEDRVYDQPSDDSHATELWAMSKYLWSMAKLVNRHSILIEHVQENFNQFAERSNDHDWLDDISRDFRQCGIAIQEDFIRPTEHMIDLMYKSVSIRDSRQSLELNASLWRLSWITFIFLPLTFLVGFFGMNVDIFEHDPSVKYYFIAAIPLMTIIFLLWFAVRRYVPSDGSLHVYSSRSNNLDEAERPP